MEQKPEPEGSLNPMPSRRRRFKCIPRDTEVPILPADVPVIDQNGNLAGTPTFDPLNPGWTKMRRTTLAEMLEIQEIKAQPAALAWFKPTLDDRIIRGFWWCVDRVRRALERR